MRDNPAIIKEYLEKGRTLDQIRTVASARGDEELKKLVESMMKKKT
jgi:predicted CopG family antitoxin